VWQEAQFLPGLVIEGRGPISDRGPHSSAQCYIFEGSPGQRPVGPMGQVWLLHRVVEYALFSLAVLALKSGQDTGEIFLSQEAAESLLCIKAHSGRSRKKEVVSGHLASEPKRRQKALKTNLRTTKLARVQTKWTINAVSRKDCTHITFICPNYSVLVPNQYNN